MQFLALFFLGTFSFPSYSSSVQSETVGFHFESRNFRLLSKTSATTLEEKRAKSLEIFTVGLQKWMENVYLANPDELRKSTQVSPREMTEWVFHGPFNWKFDAVRELQNNEALALSLSTDYYGDRILAFTTGAYTLVSSYIVSNGNINSTQIKPISISIQEIILTLESLMQGQHNHASTIIISDKDYKELVFILNSIQYDVATT